MFDKLKKAFGGSSEPEAPKVEEKVEAAPAETPKAAPAEEKAASAKPRIGYIHLSGCTGDAMSLTENYDILSTVLTDMIDIVYGQTLVDKWIHGTYAEEMPEMDLCLIEGSVCLQDEHSLHEIQEARKKSKLICAFGSCAMTGCFTTFARGGQQAQPKHESFVPVSSLVKVDLALPGCPVAPEMIANAVVALCNGDLEYLQPAIDKAACNTGCGCDVLTNIIRNGLCSGCGTCALACPTRAMGFTEGRPSCDRDRCIKCGTCYAMCPRAWLPIKRIKENTGL
ncbi:coenzyme F420 hydrogenase subunit gamma [uncultured Methanobrevibacter sp.]|uniref:coenzyme F420 hydrogenase subunit gamma n=1 Tax=uncultured Methanobrevibacter sp. TaxID=253161 RepID=UPI0025CB8215|nr:coenzyme F420 hydrogenase subunit gamma [uncultured Methanobrevibacter sp.]